MASVATLLWPNNCLRLQELFFAPFVNVDFFAPFVNVDFPKMSAGEAIHIVIYNKSKENLPPY